MRDQVEVARRTVEEAADRQPWWVRTAHLRGTLWNYAGSMQAPPFYSDEDNEDSDTSSDEEEGGINCNCDFCTATRMGDVMSP